MERKNTVLLTVIAIATLLVAVVGATFAYFTAQFQTSQDGNNKIDATAAVLPTVSFDYGDTIEVPEDLYPGYKFLKKVKVTGTCQNSQSNCKTVDLVLTLTPDIPEEFKGAIKYEVYKAATTVNDAITCTNTKKEETDASGIVKYSYDGKCKAGNNVYHGDDFSDAVTAGDIEETGYSGTFKTTTEGSDDVVIVIEGVTGNTSDNYYVVVDYVDSGSDDQATQQGKKFSVTLKANLQP